MRVSWLFSPFHIDHIVKSFEAGVNARVAGLGIVAQVEDGNTAVSADVLQHRHSVYFRRTAEGFDVHDSVEAGIGVADGGSQGG